MARYEEAMGRTKTKEGTHIKLAGRIISPGIAFGYAHIEEPVPSSYPLSVPPEAVGRELTRLDAAVERVRMRLEEYLRDFHSSEEQDLQQILHVQLIILADQEFFSSIHRRIEAHHLSAEHAVEEEFSVVANRLGASRDYYLRARADDLRGICQLVLKALILGSAAFGPIDRDKKAPVYFSANLRPTGVLRARKAGAVAFVTSSSAYTSHAAILLRSSGIPALGGETLSDLPLQEGTPLLVDAIRGELHIHPTERVKKNAFSVAKRLKETVAHRALPPMDAFTPEGKRIRLWANIDHPSQAVLCLQHRLTGIGLFRTEFMVLDTGRIPDEEEQYVIYRRVVEQLGGRPLVLRTFDIGGDKVMDGLHDLAGPNPALGVRGIRRHLMRRPKELRTQIRAILRAACDAKVSILFPMVTHAGDILSARAHIEAVRTELEEEQLSFNPDVKVGAMIEIPSAALQVSKILENVDFVSIGTNDLLQYLTASDRDNPEVIAYHDPETSGLKRILTWIMEQARAMGRVEDVGVCGEIASDLEGARFLAEIGITSLSISPGFAPALRKALKKQGP